MCCIIQHICCGMGTEGHWTVKDLPLGLLSRRWRQERLDQGDEFSNPAGRDEPDSILLDLAVAVKSRIDRAASSMSQT